jgi:hypothetical protein
VTRVALLVVARVHVDARAHHAIRARDAELRDDDDRAARAHSQRLQTVNFPFVDAISYLRATIALLLCVWMADSSAEEE